MVLCLSDTKRQVKGDMMMYELIILAQLMRYPAHGYLIAKIINDMIGPYAHLSNGRLYPLLSKLEKSGLIMLHIAQVGEQQGDRQLRRYEITATGRKRFHELMMNTTANPGEYQKLFTQKAAFFTFLKPIERLRLIDHYRNYCQAHTLHLTSEAEEMAREGMNWEPAMNAVWVQDVLNVMQHTIDQWELEVRWVEGLREKENVLLREAGALNTANLSGEV